MDRDGSLLQWKQTRSTTMPDWSYHPLIKPILFRMPPDRACALALGAVGRLGASAAGRTLIDFMGHMRPPRRLGVTVAGIDFPSPLGLAAGLDPCGRARAGFERFGFGFVELGPVRPATSVDPQPERDTESGDLICARLPAATVDTLRAALAGAPRHLPTGVRLEPSGEGDTAAAIAELRSLVDFFMIAPSTGACLRAATDAAQGVPVFRCVPADYDGDPGDLAASCREAGLAGVQVAGEIARGDRIVVGRSTRDAALDLVRRIRAVDADLPIMASGGVAEPADALALLDAGADLIQIRTGLVFSGPGLPKRINEAILGRSPEPAARAVPRLAWAPLFLLGLGMIFCGILAWIVAVTRVVLPYDEAFLGMPRAGIAAVNPHLLHFMTHDRVTLAGTMVSIGIVYCGLAYGVRNGAHWAWISGIGSALLGFLSFFLFLGFGYFDPLHALIAAILFVVFVPCLFGGSRMPSWESGGTGIGLANDGAWRRGLLGQLLFVCIGVGLILAGIVIAGVGVTNVFVPTDLMFLMTTRDAITSANPHLLPLIAHDRAGFGGALASDGVAVLTTALWGFRPGARWVWWTLLFAGLPGFTAAIWVHVHIGYLNLVHVGPAYLAVLLFGVGLALSRSMLFAR